MSAPSGQARRAGGPVRSGSGEVGRTRAQTRRKLPSPPELSASQFAGSPSRTGSPLPLLQAARVNNLLEIFLMRAVPERTALVTFSDKISSPDEQPRRFYGRRDHADRSEERRVGKEHRDS